LEEAMLRERAGECNFFTAVEKTDRETKRQSTAGDDSSAKGPSIPQLLLR
jgi:hypothetical protein